MGARIRHVVAVLAGVFAASCDTCGGDPSECHPCDAVVVMQQSEQVADGVWSVPLEAAEHCVGHELPRDLERSWDLQACREQSANYLVHTIDWDGDIDASHRRETENTFACDPIRGAPPIGCPASPSEPLPQLVGPYDPCTDERDAVAMLISTADLALPSPTALAEDLVALTDANVPPEPVFVSRPCTAFLVGPRHVLTVAHCVSPVPLRCGGEAPDRLDGSTLLFDYTEPDPSLATPVTGMTVVACGRDSPDDVADHSHDWALLELDSPQGDREPLQLPPAGTGPEQCATVYTLGHPLGHPQKCIGTETEAMPTAWTMSDVHRSGGDVTPTFNTTLDVLHSLSGAPVFDFESDTLVGMHRQGTFLDGQGLWRAGAAECTPLDKCGEELTLGALTSTLAPFLAE
jgi:hypothetical protein